MAKTYVANYLFNYFGGDKVGDKRILREMVRKRAVFLRR